MNKFNKKTVNSIKVRRDNARVKKKRIGTVKGHKKGVAAVSGARTGKAQRRKERQQRLKEKEEVKNGADQVMRDAEAQ